MVVYGKSGRNFLRKKKHKIWERICNMGSLLVGGLDTDTDSGFEICPNVDFFPQHNQCPHLILHQRCTFLSLLYASPVYILVDLDNRNVLCLFFQAIWST